MNEIGGMGPFNGIKIIENEFLSKTEPILKLRNNIAVSDEFRAKCDAFYLDLFGDKPVFYMIDGCITAHPDNIGYMKAQLFGVIK